MDYLSKTKTHIKSVNNSNRYKFIKSSLIELPTRAVCPLPLCKLEKPQSILVQLVGIFPLWILTSVFTRGPIDGIWLMQQQLFLKSFFQRRPTLQRLGRWQFLAGAETQGRQFLWGMTFQLWIDMFCFQFGLFYTFASHQLFRSKGFEDDTFFGGILLRGGNRLLMFEMGIVVVLLYLWALEEDIIDTQFGYFVGSSFESI